MAETLPLEATVEGGTSFVVHTVEKAAPAVQLATGVHLGVFCDLWVEKLSVFNTELVDHERLFTRSSRFSRDDYVVVNGAIVGVEDSPETFRVTVTLENNRVGESALFYTAPRETNPELIDVRATSRWVPAVTGRKLYSDGVWAAYSGTEKLSMYSSGRDEDGNIGTAPLLLDEGLYAIYDSVSGEVRDVDAVQFTGSSFMATRTEQWGSGEVGAMMVAVVNPDLFVGGYAHLIGFSPQPHAAGFSVRMDGSGHVMLCAEGVREGRDTPVPDYLVSTDLRGAVGTPMLFGLRYSALDSKAYLLVRSPFVKNEYEVGWSDWAGVPPEQQLASCELQLFYSSHERSCEVLDVALWIGDINVDQWNEAAAMYSACYGVR